MANHTDLLKGPIVTLKEDGPTNRGSSPQEARPLSIPFPPSEPIFQTTSTLAARPHHQVTHRRLTGKPASPLITDVQVHARPVLLDSSHVRNQVMENLRIVSESLLPDAENRPQVFDEAPRVDSWLQKFQNPSRGGATSANRAQFTGMYRWAWAISPAAIY